jgi:hypothetical protein
MALDVKISEMPATFAVNPADLFVIVDLSGQPITKKISAAYLSTLAPVQSVAGKAGNVSLEINDISGLQTALNGKQAAGNYIKLVWELRAIDGATHNYAAGSANMLLISASNSAQITGFAGGTSSSWLRIINASSAPLILAHQNSGSIAANRLIIPAGVNYTLGENEEALAIYDPISTRWRITTSCVTPY